MTQLSNKNIEDGAISTSKIGDLQVSEVKIAAGAVTEAKIGTAAVTEAKIGAAAVTNAKIGAGAVTADKVDLADDFTWTGAHDFTGGGITTPTPSNDNDAANKGYVDSVAAGLKWKDSVRVRAQGNITLGGPGANIDGVPMNLNDRVLCDQQSTGTEDGIYLWKGAAVAMVRSADAQVGDNFASVALFVEEGTDADLPKVCTNDQGSAIIGTHDLNFTNFSGASLPHALGGSAHLADTLGNLNSKITGGDVLVSRTKANTWSQKQTFQSGAAADSPIKLDPMAVDPSSLADGDVWPTTAGAIYARLNGATKRLDENVKQYMHKVTAGEVALGYLTLPSTPVNAQSVRVDIHRGVRQANKQTVGATGATPDFDVIGAQLHVNNNGAATGLSGHITTDDILIVDYQE